MIAHSAPFQKRSEAAIIAIIMEEKMIIALVGMKHCGKSSVGKIVAKMLNLPFADTDALLERAEGKTARELFVEGGAALMAAAEAKACEEAVKIAQGRGAVVSTGGGFCDNERAVSILRDHSIFCLIDADFDALYGRILRRAKRDGEMPAFLRGENPKEQFSSIYMARMQKYRLLADLAVKSIEDAPPRSVADALLRELRERYPRLAALSGKE